MHASIYVYVYMHDYLSNVACANVGACIGGGRMDKYSDQKQRPSDQQHEERFEGSSSSHLKLRQDRIR